jgi:putative tryptophan/tyrosine transport system substrate-binding protein
MTESPSPLTMLLSRHTRRREFIALLGGLAAAWPAGIDAQQRPKVTRIGILDPSPAGVPSLDAFYQAVHELGYAEGKNIVIERRYGEWRPDQFREAAAELGSRLIKSTI